MRFGWLVSIATAFVLIGASVIAFLNPWWVGFEQSRAGVAASFQDCPAEVGRITGSILGDLVVGGEFDVRSQAGANACPAAAPASGPPVLDEGERGHMRDVAGVFRGFFLLVIAAAVWLIVTGRRARRAGAMAPWLRAVRSGAVGLVALAVVLGAVALVAFDAAFEVFHRLFFAVGSYSFDPRTSHLVQLFPDQFWSETTLALGAVVIVLSLGVTWLASRWIAAHAPVGSPADVTPRPLGELAK